MDSLIKHIESNATKYNNNNKDLNVRVVNVGKEIDKIVLTNYIINEKTETIYDGKLKKYDGKLKKEVPKTYYGEITHKSDWEKHIEHINTPKILGYVDNINDILE